MVRSVVKVVSRHQLPIVIADTVAVGPFTISAVFLVSPTVVVLEVVLLAVECNRDSVGTSTMILISC